MWCVFRMMTVWRKRAVLQPHPPRSKTEDAHLIISSIVPTVRYMVRVPGVTHNSLYTGLQVMVQC